VTDTSIEQEHFCEQTIGSFVLVWELLDVQYLEKLGLLIGFLKLPELKSLISL